MSKYKTIDISQPKDGSVVKLDRYWLCKNGDLKEAVFFDRMPQANKHKQIPERIKSYTEEQTGWTLEVVYSPIAYIPNNP